MKTTTLRKAAAAGLTALVIGNAAAQESVSKPVGYETLTVEPGFNYLGLRLHEAPVTSGAAVGDPVGAVVTVADGIADALVANTAYIFEVTASDDSIGAVVMVDSFDAATDTITLSDDMSANFFDGDEFTIRPAATLASVFGEDNSAGLANGLGGAANADQVWIIGEDGSFEKYYFDNEDFNNFGREWVLVSDGQTIVDPSTVVIPYTDGIIIFGEGAAKSFVVSGSVKLTPTNYVVQDGFNYLSSVSPVGATLETMFGATNSAGLSFGLGGAANADQVWVPGAGGFVKYYFDNEDFNNFEQAWVLVSDGVTVVDPSTVSLDGASGFIIFNEGGEQQVNTTAPSFYSNL